MDKILFKNFRNQKEVKSAEKRVKQLIAKDEKAAKAAAYNFQNKLDFIVYKLDVNKNR